MPDYADENTMTNRPEQIDAPIVSVIIPVHGVEAYIETCLRSVQTQSLREIEIIPVNDASPDDSQAVIDRLAARDTRIQPITLSENIGQGFARNKALDVARGKYIWLLDGDDWLPNPDMLAELVRHADAENCDLVRGRKAEIAVFSDKDVFLESREDPDNAHFPTRIGATTYADHPALLHSPNCWNFLYRREFLNTHDIRFLTPQWEERAFVVNALTHAIRIGVSRVPCTAYRMRTGSTMRRDRTARDFDLQLKNFDASFDILLAAGAASRSHALRPHLEFHLSKLVEHMFVAGPYRFYRAAGQKARSEFLAHLEGMFARCDFRAGDFDPDFRLAPDYGPDRAALALVVAAIRTSRDDLVDAAAAEHPIAQDLYLDEMLRAPEGVLHEDLQVALNCYARNDRIAHDHAVTGHGKARPRIVVHIGATKTGSTYLQHLLEASRPALLRAGVWFPEVGLFWQRNRPHKQAGHAQFSACARRGDPALRKHIEAGLTRLGDTVHTIILSSEAFFLEDDAQLIADYFDGFDVEMIAYLRRQDDWANAQYCEFVAGGAVGRVDEPIAVWLDRPDTRRQLDYRTPIRAWSDKVGAENITVRLYNSREFVDGSLIADFAQALNLPILNTLADATNPARNEAQFGAAHVELIRHFNGLPFDSRASYFAFIEEVSRGCAAIRAAQGAAPVKPWVLPEEAARKIMEEARASNDEIASDVLGRDGPLFRGQATCEPDSARLTQAEIALVGAAYDRAKPRTDRGGFPVPKRFAKDDPAPERPSPRVLSYGLLGWRLWGLSPVLAATMTARNLDPELVLEFMREPAEFAREKWSPRRPFITGLMYPNANPYGPGGLLRFWKPVLRQILVRSGRGHMVNDMMVDPILFVRSMANPVFRLVGRVMFPLGEKRD